MKDDSTWTMGSPNAQTNDYSASGKISSKIAQVCYGGKEEDLISASLAEECFRENFVPEGRVGVHQIKMKWKWILSRGKKMREVSSEDLAVAWAQEHHQWGTQIMRGLGWPQSHVCIHFTTKACVISGTQ